MPTQRQRITTNGCPPTHKFRRPSIYDGKLFLLGQNGARPKVVSNKQEQNQFKNEMKDNMYIYIYELVYHMCMCNRETLASPTTMIYLCVIQIEEVNKNIRIYCCHCMLHVGCLLCTGVFV